MKTIKLPLIVVTCPEQYATFTFTKEDEAFDKFKELVLLNAKNAKYTECSAEEFDSLLKNDFNTGFICEGLSCEIHVLKTELEISKEIFDFITNSAVNLGQALLNGYYENLEKQQA